MIRSVIAGGRREGGSVYILLLSRQDHYMVSSLMECSVRHGDMSLGEERMY